MDIPFYQIDAFTDLAFGGNPAAVCPLDRWLPDGVLQAIAAENNLAETAFIVPHAGDDADYHLRWFTPGTEVDLCGHATLATAHMLFSHMVPEAAALRFTTLSGILSVVREGDRLVMDFPVDRDIRRVDPPMTGLAEAMGAAPLEVWQGVRDFLLVYPDADAVRALAPDMPSLKALGHYGYIATAAGDDGSISDGGADFVSRFFAPSFAIDEDPVTGSAHCLSAPYWAEKLGKRELFARQISARSGDLWLRLDGPRLHIAGQAVEVIRGTLRLDSA